jgi:hypothetical protein
LSPLSEQGNRVLGCVAAPVLRLIDLGTMRVLTGPQNCGVIVA